ncbi:N-acyl-D-amino-acid deacylase family protein [Halorubellus salinus]|uniref:N-acyl-D-amino-acid deacylase family protein n=1 Tax=Halorubellus salinus TaxID=755309 RepID=UPI001D078962|nr:D-aminoacylase [Halorubellus salinus]
MLDVLLTNARVVDGTGAPWFRGAVGVRDGEIATVERVPDPTDAPDAALAADDVDAETVVDVDDAVVAPGFVDTHSHSDLQLFDDPTLAPKARQGITTEIVGQDGFSMAPMRRDGGAEEWQDQLSGLAGRVDREWTWGGVGDYLDAVEGDGVAPNVGTLVGQGTVRFNVMGMRDDEPTESELEEMADLVTEAMDDGAFGLSTALVITPCSYASTEEITHLAERLEPYGRPFVAHIRSERADIWSALDEFVDVGADANVPVHLSHFKLGGPPQHGKADRALALVEAARDRGVDFSADQYPYAASNTLLSYVLPPWVHADGPEQAVAYLEDADARQRILRDVEENRIDGWDNPGWYSGWENVVVASVESDANDHLEGLTVQALADEWDTEPILAVCDLLAEEDLAVSCVNHFIDEDDVRDILAHERVNVITDGLFGGNPHPRVYGAFAKVLGTYVRDEDLVSVEEAVRMMTSLPARSMGLDSKGVLRPGMDADVTVFDPAVVGSPATYENPTQYADGVPHVLVNGEFVVRDGETTGATPGDALRA